MYFILGGVNIGGNITTDWGINQLKPNRPTVFTVVNVNAMPGTNYGVLIVLPTGGNYPYIQIYFPAGGGSPVYQRRYLSSTEEWSAWI